MHVTECAIHLGDDAAFVGRIGRYPDAQIVPAASL